MVCPCQDPKTGEIKDVTAKTKEMVYRSQAPWIQEAIKRDKQQSQQNHTIKQDQQNQTPNQTINHSASPEKFAYQTRIIKDSGSHS